MIQENEISISVIRDSLFFSSVNRARDPLPSPCTTLKEDLLELRWVLGLIMKALELHYHLIETEAAKQKQK